MSTTPSRSTSRASSRKKDNSPADEIDDELVLEIFYPEKLKEKREQEKKNKQDSKGTEKQTEEEQQQQEKKRKELKEKKRQRKEFYDRMAQSNAKKTNPQPKEETGKTNYENETSQQWHPLEMPKPKRADEDYQPQIPCKESTQDLFNRSCASMKKKESSEPCEVKEAPSENVGAVSESLGSNRRERIITEIVGTESTVSRISLEAILRKFALFNTKLGKKLTEQIKEDEDTYDANHLLHILISCIRNPQQRPKLYKAVIAGISNFKGSALTVPVE